MKKLIKLITIVSTIAMMASCQQEVDDLNDVYASSTTQPTETETETETETGTKEEIDIVRIMIDSEIFMSMLYPEGNAISEFYVNPILKCKLLITDETPSVSFNLYFTCNGVKETIPITMYKYDKDSEYYSSYENVKDYIFNKKEKITSIVGREKYILVYDNIVRYTNVTTKNGNAYNFTEDNIRKALEENYLSKFQE